MYSNLSHKPSEKYLTNSQTQDDRDEESGLESPKVIFKQRGEDE